MQQLCRYNRAWYVDQERCAVNIIDTKKSTLNIHDQVSLFWILSSNTLQVRFIPGSSFTDSFFIIKLQPIDVLYTRQGITDILKPFKSYFGETATDTRNYISDHSEELMYHLYFNDQLMYDKHTSAMTNELRLPALNGYSFLQLDQGLKNQCK
ncbi:hypothetical protein BCR41DRAFT_352556 [Lobosporangium transversale]|uniref:Uncharacterized protein n=1 Tax=Lobosporangium transversale TaxID=64571 RepID=A0A1Y2GQQ5_9FUNG|nr:hypothetical protein BCR41DRAFT_352556 [Lobosporangium transversale]ORZ17472.1 hypothetical protein BCR41DRAFT_352556 [Lobosporangium transversale]|eukprot:XP_021881859.1 hypothetical protein BCR41DRAFT_352556 [Lobosporangium transversale]